MSSKWHVFGVKKSKVKVRVRVNAKVCIITQKGIISVLKLDIGNGLGISYKWLGFGLKGQRSTLGLTAIRRWFKLYECLPVDTVHLHLILVSGPTHLVLRRKMSLWLRLNISSQLDFFRWSLGVWPVLPKIVMKTLASVLAPRALPVTASTSYSRHITVDHTHRQINAFVRRS